LPLQEDAMMSDALTVHSSRLILVLAIVSSTVSAAQTRRATPEAALASAREALGGAHVLGVKSLLLQGESQALNLANSQMSPPSLLEIRVLLPDHYLRIDMTETIERRSGFSGETVLNAIKPLKPDVNVSGSWGPEQIKTERYTISRLILGLLARTDVLQGLRPSGASGDTITFEAPDGFAATLELHGSTRVPVRLRYRSFVRFPPPAGQPIVGPPPGADAEVTIAFSERRPVGGVLLPHRITTTAKDYTLSDLRFHKIVVNPKFTPEDFTK
jgi:hypothetical protein